MPRAQRGKVEPPPWDEIRRLYEETSIGCVGLAKRFGFKSKTTITRRRDAEGWAKAVEEHGAVAAAEQVVADIRSDAAPVTAPPEPEPDPEIERAIDAMGIYDPLPGPLPAAVHEPYVAAERVLAADVGRSGMVPGSADIDDRREAVVSQIADIQAERMKTHLAYASELMQVGVGVIRLIKAPTIPASTTDPVKLALKQHALMSLSGVNPDRETLAGLLKSAADVVTKGITLERHVLGITPPEKTKVGAVVITTGSNTVVSEPAGPGQVLKSLDTKSAWKMRELLAEASRAARRQQTGQAGG